MRWTVCVKDNYKVRGRHSCHSMKFSTFYHYYSLVVAGPIFAQAASLSNISPPIFCVSKYLDALINLPGSEFGVAQITDPNQCSVDDGRIFNAPSASCSVFICESNGILENDALGSVFKIDDMYSLVAVAVDADLLSVDQALFNVKRQVIYTPNNTQTFKQKYLNEENLLLHFASDSNQVMNGINNEQLRQMLNSTLQKSVFTKSLRKLTGDIPLNAMNEPLRTRYTHSPDNKKAADFLLSYMQQLDFKAHISTFRIGMKAEAGRNIIAQCKGTTRPDEVVVIGSHFDCTSENPMSRAPGAVDDGSGTAAVMTIAHAVSQAFPRMNETGCFDRTVVFLLAGGEEQGLLGSRDFVQETVRNQPGGGRSRVNGMMVGAIMMDMISYSKRFLGVKVEGTRNSAIQSLMQTVSKNMRKYAPDLTQDLSSRSFGSDHVSFQDANVPAVLLIEQDDTQYPNYHRSTDTFTSSNVNMQQTMGILRGLATSMVDMCQVDY